MTQAWLSRLSLALIVSAGATSCLGDASDVMLREEYLLPIPPILEPSRKDEGADYYTMTQKVASQHVVPGRPPSTIEGYDGVWPGPTIVARRGRRAVVTQVNQLGHPVTTHNHGHKVEAGSDGHPSDFLMPGASRDYVYPNDQSAGTYWLHDHVMGQTGRNVMNGLASFYIIRDDFWDGLNLPSGEYDVPLLVQDRTLDGGGNLLYPEPPFADTACVNGVRTPRFDVAARRYLFRLLNGSDIRQYRIEMIGADPEVGRDAPRVPFTVVASDGGLLPQSIQKEDLFISPAERYAFVVDFSKYPVGTFITMQNRLQPVGTTSRNTPFPALERLMQFHITRTAVDDSAPPPDTLAPFEAIDPNHVDVVRNITFGRTDSARADQWHWPINGKDFDPGRIDFRAKLGQTERWDILNPTTIPHSLHLHLVQFQVVEINFGPPPPELVGWKDTVFVPAGGQAKIVLRWEGYRGVYVFHCHFLEHEDTGMMAQVEVE